MGRYAYDSRVTLINSHQKSPTVLNSPQQSPTVRSLSSEPTTEGGSGVSRRAERRRRRSARVLRRSGCYLLDVLDGFLVHERLPGGGVVEDGDGHPPGALAADAPVRPPLRHRRDAVLPHRGDPLHRANARQRLLAEALHRRKPLGGGAEDGGLLGAPVVRVLVCVALLHEKRLALRQRVNHRLVALAQHVQPLEPLAGVLRKVALVVHGGVQRQVVLQPGLVVLLPVAGSGVHQTRAALGRDVVPSGHHRAADSRRRKQTSVKRVDGFVKHEATGQDKRSPRGANGHTRREVRAPLAAGERVCVHASLEGASLRLRHHLQGRPDLRLEALDQVLGHDEILTGAFLGLKHLRYRVHQIAVHRHRRVCGDRPGGSGPDGQRQLLRHRLHLLRGDIYDLPSVSSRRRRPKTKAPSDHTRQKGTADPHPPAPANLRGVVGDFDDGHGDVDGARGVPLRVFELRLGECGAAGGAPVHRLLAAVDVPVKEHLAKDADLRRLVRRQEGHVGVLPIAPDAVPARPKQAPETLQTNK
eukprot:1196191-Prorocentrum_minimum.AAC.7